MTAMRADEAYANLTIEQCADKLIAGHSSSMSAYHIGLRIREMLKQTSEFDADEYMRRPEVQQAREDFFSEADWEREST